MENETISITFNSRIDNDNSKWMEWYNDAKKVINLLGYNSSHVGIKSSKLKSGQVMILPKNEKKIINAIKSGEEIKYISMFSLPEDFKSASFDYNVFLVRDYDYVTLIANKSDFYNVDEEILVEILKKYAGESSGEIYEMDRYEFPLIYAAKANPISFFKSLKIIKKID